MMADLPGGKKNRFSDEKDLLQSESVRADHLLNEQESNKDTSGEAGMGGGSGERFLVFWHHQNGHTMP